MQNQDDVFTRPMILDKKASEQLMRMLLASREYDELTENTKSEAGSSDE